MPVLGEAPHRCGRALPDYIPLLHRHPEITRMPWHGLLLEKRAGPGYSTHSDSSLYAVKETEPLLNTFNQHHRKCEIPIQ